MTKFESALKSVKDGTLTVPRVSTSNGGVDYFWFQLCSHHYWLKLFAIGMKARQINLKTLKDYYGLKGRSAKDCLVEFEKIKDDYEARLKLARAAGMNLN